MTDSNKNYQPFLDALDALGFCSFRVFDDAIIRQLRDLYQLHFATREISGLYASHNSNPAEKGLAVSHAIRDIVSGVLDDVLPDYEFFLGHFMVKGAHENKAFALHQDWNIVDESKHKSYQIWIPLQLTYAANGGLYVVPGSHRFFNNHRSGSYSIPVVQNWEGMSRIATDIIVPAGNVVMYHNGLFHASHPNTTDDIRMAVIVNYVQKSAPTYFFQKNEAKATTDLYSVTGDSLIAHLPDLEKGIVGADLPPAGSMPLSPIDNHAVTYRDLEQHYDALFRSAAPQVKQLHVAKDPALELELDQKGYKVIDFLNEGEVLDFRSKYNSLFRDLDRTPGRFTTLQHTDNATKKSIHQFIVQHTKRAMDELFRDYIIPVSQYYTKKAHTSGDIDLHADSTLLLNHQLEPHYAIWVPLVDVDERNGCLTVIPGSHRYQRAIYGGSFRGRQESQKELLRHSELPIRLRAGQAVIFDNNLLHNSTANSTDQDRICFTFRLTHTASDYYSFICQDPARRDLDIYLESHDYYMNDMWDGEGDRITGRHRGTMRDAIREMQPSELTPLT